VTKGREKGTSERHHSNSKKKKFSGKKNAGKRDLRQLQETVKNKLPELQIEGGVGPQHITKKRRWKERILVTHTH